MRKTSSAPHDDGATFLVIELVHYPRGAKSGVELVISRPGRDGTFSRKWSCASGIPSNHQVDDLSAWAVKNVQNALVAWTGIQIGLPDVP
jgi:hypothetical protein